ncbi:hypothetical protein PCASD_21201 [Puccinia coronata f. sp. avenae]|uniref:Uncharacterized protein n=1 Tax=Puccinia coronata f. sp. avenae TaxID=200324 RepID=A0A2N5TWJ6_9BASI|nr:hypothetical protein PCASD_21201 [Puccinia coronata f. sp. avenae]
MDIMFYINNYIQDLISDALLSPFGQAKQKLHHLSSTSFWPNLQTAAVRKPLTLWKIFKQ